MPRIAPLLGGLTLFATLAAAAFASTPIDQRRQLSEMLGLPPRGGALHAEARGTLTHDGLVIEKWVLTTEPGSRMLRTGLVAPGSVKPAAAIALIAAQ